MAVKIVAFWLFAVGLIACRNVDSSCVHFSGDTGLVAGVCGDGEACTNFANAATRGTRTTAKAAADKVGNHWSFSTLSGGVFDARHDAVAVAEFLRDVGGTDGRWSTTGGKTWRRVDSNRGPRDYEGFRKINKTNSSTNSRDAMCS
jgi:hypothetical protein